MGEEPIVEMGYVVYEQTSGLDGAEFFDSQQQANAAAKALLQNGRRIPVIILPASRVRFAGQSV